MPGNHRLPPPRPAVLKRRHNPTEECRRGLTNSASTRDSVNTGYELLHVLGKGAKPADIPPTHPVLRAVREAINGHSTGPMLRTRTGRRMDRAGASRSLTRVAHAAGITRPISPHGLRRTFCTTGLVAGIGIRDM